MKRLAYMGLALLLAAGYFTMAAPRAQAAPAAGQREQARSLSGQVQERGGAAVAEAVVYLKNTRNLAVKTFISDPNGNYRFHALSTNVDYEVWAEKDGRRSDTRTLSSFDSRSEAVINLQLK